MLTRSEQTPCRYRRSTHRLLLRRRLLKMLQANRQQPPTYLSNRHHKTRRFTEAEAQTPEANAPRLPPIEVMDEESNQQILGAKAALAASTRKNLTIEFSEDRSSYYYSGSNRGTNVTGQCSMLPPSDTATIHFHLSVLIGGRDQRCLEFLFGSEPIKQMVAKIKQADAAEKTQNGSTNWTESLCKSYLYNCFSRRNYGDGGHALFSPVRGYGINTDRLDANQSGLRCTFKRIE